MLRKFFVSSDKFFVRHTTFNKVIINNNTYINTSFDNNNTFIHITIRVVHYLHGVQTHTCLATPSSPMYYHSLNNSNCISSISNIIKQMKEERCELPQAISKVYLILKEMF